MIVRPSTNRGIIRQLRKRIADLEGELGEQKRIANARINELECMIQKFKIETKKEQPDEQPDPHRDRPFALTEPV